MTAMLLAFGHATGGIVSFVFSLWLIVVLGGVVLGWARDALGAGLHSLHAAGKRRRRRQRLELEALELQVAQARAALPAPGPCRHRKAVPVRDAEGTVVAWLCRGCDTQLPPEFSIYAEDL